MDNTVQSQSQDTFKKKRRRRRAKKFMASINPKQDNGLSSPQRHTETIIKENELSIGASAREVVEHKLAGAWAAITAFFRGLSKFEVGAIVMFSVVVAAVTALLVMQLSAPRSESTGDDYSIDKSGGKIFTKQFGIMRKINALKKKHNYYKSITSEEICIRWIEMFDDVKYRMNGNIKFKEADCVSAVWHFLDSYGYSGAIMSVQEMVRVTDNLTTAGLLLKRNKSNGYRDLKPGDLIMFHPTSRGGAPHIGIAYALRDGYVCFVDVNAAVGRGDNFMRATDGRINKIVEVSFPLFAGELFKKMNLTSE